MRRTWARLRPRTKAAITLVVLATTAQYWVPAVLLVVGILLTMLPVILVAGACWGLLTVIYSLKEAK